MCIINRRRAQQLKNAKQKEKEWQKAQSRKDRNAAANAVSSKPNIQFPNNVVLLEAAARNDIAEVSITFKEIKLKAYNNLKRPRTTAIWERK